MDLLDLFGTLFVLVANLIQQSLTSMGRRKSEIQATHHDLDPWGVISHS